VSIFPVQSADYWVYRSPVVTQIPYVRSQDSQPLAYDIAVFNSYGNGLLDKIPGTDVGVFTGLNVPPDQRSLFERTISKESLGWTTVQAYQDYVGVMLNTFSAPPSDSRTLKTINYGMDFSGANKIKPWAQFGDGARYCIANFAAVPDFYSEGAVGYVIPRVSFVDEVTGKSIIFGATLWDSRSSDQNEWIFFDGNWSGATNSIVASSVYRPGARYTTQADWSAGTQQGIKWSDDRWFGYCITKQNIINVKNDLANQGQILDVDPDRMYVGTSGIEFEMATDINGVVKGGWMAARMKELNLFIQY
jgi:hypothetical protein